MKYFFVDTENVQKYNFIEDMELNDADKIVMFMSEKSQKVRAEDLRRFTGCSAKIEYEDVYTGGNNALDFQLIANLSMVVAINAPLNIEYCIVSNDNDFELPVKYLVEKMGANIQILKTETNQLAITIDEENIDKYKDFGFDTRTLNVIKHSETLSQLHNNLKNLHGNEKGRDLYVKVKSVFKAN